MSVTSISETLPPILNGFSGVLFAVGFILLTLIAFSVVLGMLSSDRLALQALSVLYFSIVAGVFINGGVAEMVEFVIGAAIVALIVLLVGAERWVRVNNRITTYGE